MNKPTWVGDAIEEITEAVENLIELSKGYERGQCIPWELIESIAGARDDSRPRYIIKKWRRLLEQEHETITLCADGIGVRLLTDEEAAEEIPMLRQRKAYRQVNRGIRQIAVINELRLTDHQRLMLARQTQNMIEQRRRIHQSQQQLARGVIKTEAMPLRPSQ